MTELLDIWPAGAVWAFQGTVAEDATAGTHVATLTVSTGVGNELWIEYGSITQGNTATAQTSTVRIDDGTNVLTDVFLGGANVTASMRHSFPDSLGTTRAAVTTSTPLSLLVPFIHLAGPMRIVLTTTTTAISVTHAFALVCRIKGAIPAATLADTVGTPVLTTNLNAVF